MNIVILDSDPAFGSRSANDTIIGAVDCPELDRLGTIVSYPGTSTAQIVERAHQAHIIVTNKVPLGGTEFAQLPNLRLVSVLATGVNVIDLDAARAHGVTVCNVPGYSTASTAQHAVALLLELVNRVGAHSVHAQAENWKNSASFSYFLSPIAELDGKTMGIIGLGSIGTRVGKIAQALGMHVIANTRTQKNNSPFPLVQLDQLFRQSDVVSLHCPLTPETHHLINEQSLRLMKSNSLLINVARGPIVDEQALSDALAAGHLAGAACDVLSEEPPRSGSPLLQAPHCLITPHLAWASIEARQRLLQITAANIEAYLRGAPQNVVS